MSVSAKIICCKLLLFITGIICLLWIGLDGFGLKMYYEIKNPQPNGGLGYWIQMPHSLWAENNGSLSAFVTENSVPLGPRTMFHEEIRSQGGGRFSFWDSSLFFSTSDNSDPRTNGRNYQVVSPMLLPLPGIIGISFILSFWYFYLTQSSRCRSQTGIAEVEKWSEPFSNFCLCISGVLLVTILLLNPIAVLDSKVSVLFLSLTSFWSLVDTKRSSLVRISISIVSWVGAILIAKNVTGLSDTSALFGQFPFSDGRGYVSGALALLNGENVSHFAGHRPVLTVLYAMLFWLSGEGLLIFILIVSLLFSIAFILAIWELYKFSNVITALVFVLLIGSFSHRWLGNFWSEIPGLTFGLFAFVFFLRYCKTFEIWQGCAALFLLSLAMMIRAGPVFIVPLLLFGMGCITIFKTKQKTKALFSVCILVIFASLPIVASRVISANERFEKSIQFGNYSLTLYGLIQGSSWSEFQKEDRNSHLSGTELYEKAFNESIALIKQHPEKLIQGIMKSVNMGFNYSSGESIFGFVPSGLIRLGLFILWGVSLIIIIFKLNRFLPVGLLCFGILLGFLATFVLIPFWDADQMRVYAAGLPLLFFIVSVPATAYSSLFKPKNHIEDCGPAPSAAARESMPYVACAGLPFLIAIILLYLYPASQALSPESEQTPNFESQAIQIDLDHISWANRRDFGSFFGHETHQLAKSALMMSIYPQTENFLRSILSRELIAIWAPSPISKIVIISKKDVRDTPVVVQPLMLDGFIPFLVSNSLLPKGDVK